MNKSEQAGLVIRRLGEQAEKDSAIHRLSPLCKLILTVVFIGITTSYGKYDLSGIAPMVLIPVVLYQFAGVSVGECFYRMRYVMPLVCAVGIVNPILDRETMLCIGAVEISGGIISMTTLIIKGILCLMMSYLLVATTSVEELCASLGKMHVPGFMITLLLLSFRFVSILLEEVSVMTDAYKLRAPGQRGIHVSAWGSFLGQLILRSVDRAQAIYEGMVLRGYRGNVIYMGNKTYSVWSVPAMIVCVAIMVAFRLFNISELIGGRI